MHRVTNKKKNGTCSTKLKKSANTKILVRDQSMLKIEAVAKFTGLVYCCVKISAVIRLERKKPNKSNGQSHSRFDGDSHDGSHGKISRNRKADQRSPSWTLLLPGSVSLSHGSLALPSLSSGDSNSTEFLLLFGIVQFKEEEEGPPW